MSTTPFNKTFIKRNLHFLLQQIGKNRSVTNKIWIDKCVVVNHDK